MPKQALDAFRVLATDVEDNLSAIGNVVDRREVEVVMFSLGRQPLLA
jgi:hypothetical protein